MAWLSLAEKKIEKNDNPEKRKALKLVGDHAELKLVEIPNASKVEDLQYPDVKPQLQKLNKKGSEPKNKNIFALTKKSKNLE